MPETATLLEATRESVAVGGLLLALLVLTAVVSDYLVLRREGVNGPTGLVYVQMVALAVIAACVQVSFTVVGIAALLAPPPIPPALAAAISETSATAVVSIATYLDLAVKGSIFVSTATMGGSILQLTVRHLLAESLREQARIKATAGQAQQDRMEAMLTDTNDRVRTGEIGSGERAVVDRQQATEIQATGDDTNRRVRDQQEKAEK